VNGARTRRRIAVIGGGVAGLTAAWALRRDAEITLYESDDRLGGHAHTHDLPGPGGVPIPVDSGFLVHNHRTYPTLIKLFRELGVQTRPAEMSLSVRCDGCGLEYAGSRGLPGLFPQAANLVSGRYLRLLSEVPRFHRTARAELRRPDSLVPLGELVERAGFSPYFRSHFLTPLIASVWSCAPGVALQYPARYLFEFLQNHGMLSVTGSPQWMTVVGGSRTYVERIEKDVHAVRLSTAARSVARRVDGAEVLGDDGSRERFDGVVIATHADQALELLAAPTAVQHEVLGAFGYSRNVTLVHTDEAVLPRARAARASWNYAMTSCAAQPESVLVSYDVTRLQSLPTAPGGPRYLVTLNDDGRVDRARVVRRMVYEHPVYTPAAVTAQRSLTSIEDGVITFAGAYHGWGFHEDGAVAGLRAARRLGATW
jgi:predicted NAD/FAD-binding protein